MSVSHLLLGTFINEVFIFSLWAEQCRRWILNAGPSIAGGSKNQKIFPLNCIMKWWKSPVLLIRQVQCLQGPIKGAYSCRSCKTVTTEAIRRTGQQRNTQLTAIHLNLCSFSYWKRCWSWPCLPLDITQGTGASLSSYSIKLCLQRKIQSWFKTGTNVTAGQFKPASWDQAHNVMTCSNVTFL